MTRVCQELVIDPGTILAWHQEKDRHGPAFAGNESWTRYMALIEEESRKLGLIDIKRNVFNYDRWYTTEWPDSSAWGLTVGRQSIDVASYGANSGDTGPDGLTSEVVAMSGSQFQNLEDRSQLRGKILALQVEPTGFQRYMPDWVYAPPEMPFRQGQTMKLEDTVFQDTVSQLFASNFDGSLPFAEPHYLKLIHESQPAGVVIVFDMADDRARGLYSFPVPAIYDTPTLYLGREAGDKFFSALAAQDTPQATITLDSTTKRTEAYQFAGYLPGRDYGTTSDEIILMISHTDGPSVSQENGPFGLLSILHYFSQFPREHRDKTLMLFLDSRHYIPLREAALPEFDVEEVLAPGGALAPEKGTIVASVHLEHLGQIEYQERNGRYQPSGRMETGGFYVTGYEDIIDLAKQALVDHHPRNQVLRSTDIPGVHGESQGHWFGLGPHPRKLGVEAIASNMSFMGAYWASTADMDDLDVDQFIRQVNVMTQITGGFMGAHITDLLAEPLGAAGH